MRTLRVLVMYSLTGKMVIINKQMTPFESEAWLHIFADTDEVVQELMARLEVPIPLYH